MKRVLRAPLISSPAYSRESPAATFNLCLRTFVVHGDLYISRQVVIVEYLAQSDGLVTYLLATGVPPRVPQGEGTVVGLRGPGGGASGGVGARVAGTGRERCQEVLVTL